MANTKSFLFVNVSDPASNPKPGKSSQIRSRCMQGKNKREDSRRSLREKKQFAKKAQEEGRVARIDMHTTPAPSLATGNLSGSLALAQFAGTDMDSQDKKVFLRTFAYNIANQDISPLERVVDFDMLEDASFEWLFYDDAFMHSVLTASYAVGDLLQSPGNATPSRKTLLHMRKTLSLLQEKIRADAAAHKDDSVLAVISNLALLSANFGDWVATAEHFKGLQRIVELRGNLSFPNSRPNLHFKLDRVDLAYALSAGKPTFFMHPSVSWDCIVPPPYMPLPGDLYLPGADWDWRLANLFQDLQYLSLRINRFSPKRTKHHPTYFQAVLSSLQSRLMHLSSQLTNPVEELVRLTLLAFMTTVFRAPGRKVPYGWINERLGEVYREAFGGLSWQGDVTLRMWVLIIAAFTVGSPQTPWIREAWFETTGGRAWRWDDAKRILLRVMFIELVHEKPGSKALEELCNPDLESLKSVVSWDSWPST